ncbi:lytic transglycosylase domain-containing protein [Terasakiella sp.]|uniref:lytic transglycosylase domain-containing protein n=1 Tax=Terasakiella sp. TaxID=2034861 RepID=UPI003AA8341D
MKRMHIVLVLVFCGFQAASTKAWALGKDQVKQIVVEEASKTIVPPSLALAVARVESNFNPQAVSHAGARGVMQIMPATARGEFNVAASRLWEARLNIRLGVKYLEQLNHQYNGRWDLALSHYNGGTIKGNNPHSYTQKYIADVIKWQKYFERNHIGKSLRYAQRQSRITVRQRIASKEMYERKIINKINENLKPKTRFFISREEPQSTYERKQLSKNRFIKFKRRTYDLRAVNRILDTY